MLANLDLLLIAVFRAADDLLPKRAENAKRRVTDAEVVTLCVAQAIMGGRVAGGIAAPGSLRSRRDSLPSPGSSHQTVRAREPTASGQTDRAPVAGARSTTV